MQVDLDLDPFLWLEDLDSLQAREQVRAWSDATSAIVQACSAFTGTVGRMRARLDAPDRIAHPVIDHSRVYSFWTDADHPRGIWREAELEDYVAGSPSWRRLLDLDDLTRREAMRWVWAGVVFPHERTGRSMIALSDGGADAITWREFDLERGSFVTDGFQTPAGKAEIVWWDADTLLISVDSEPASSTTSGYPAQVRCWRRGARLGDAKMIAQVDADAMLIQPVMYGGMVPRFAVWSMIDHYRSTLDHLDADGRLSRSPLPASAEALTAYDGMVVALLHEKFALDGKLIAAGSLVAYAIDAVHEGQARIELIAGPPQKGIVCNVLGTLSGLIVHSIEDVQGQLKVYRRYKDGSWTERRVLTPPFSSLVLGPGSPNRSDYFYRVSSFLTPPSLHYVAEDGDDRLVARQTPCIDPADFVVEQHFFVASDGTRVPYFSLKSRLADDPSAVLIQAYGGFRAPMLPLPIGPLEQCWLEAGQKLIVANIRGGGEFGPAWHRAAIREKRQRAFDDLHALAQMLRADAAVSKIAIHGLCNGGLLAGVALTQRPDLYDAAVMVSPITDMRRYHRLLAGASWIAEYGDPDDPKDWAFLRRYSPYHNVVEDRVYPPVLLIASSNDDRVHPAHARKLAARMAQQGHRFNFVEHEEGGHYCAANSRQQAVISALQFHWLEKALGIDARTSIS